MSLPPGGAEQLCLARAFQYTQEQDDVRGYGGGVCVGEGGGAPKGYVVNCIQGVMEASL